MPISPYLQRPLRTMAQVMAERARRAGTADSQSAAPAIERPANCDEATATRAA